ncbi:MAG: DNA methyltransferase [Candidatus Parvarchaeota archaeon]|jgi:adenine specific DNA methylase Mod|nr:DNA methyltransferase [Candidatus Parvarchaeum tengchongense]MCW1312704.1 DNA methyltransferase [Candidatus Parvarchaeum tengchongense]
MNDVELVWKNKKTEVEKISLPFQKIEEVNLSRTSKGTLLPELRENEEVLWKNKLIWGDNKYVINSLLKDPAIAGKIKLIYIDPPFFTGTNMNININIGNKTELTKQPSAIEEVAYRNMWKEGVSSFLQYIYERIKVMRELLADDGSIYIRFDYHYSHYIKIILDEIFGYDNFRNEIVINRTLAKQPAKNNFTQQTESLFFYGRTENNFFKQVKTKIEPKWYPLLDFPRADEKPRTVKNVVFYPPKGRRWALSQENIDQHKTRINIDKDYIDCRGKKIKGYPELLYDEKVVRNDWLDIKGYGQSTGYPTENSEDLLSRVISASSEKGDIVADFFGGSGTTAAVAEKLNRKWIICDIGRFSIHTIRKRLLEIPTCKPFEVLNMGKYERQQWISEATKGDYKAYVSFILQLYGSKPLNNFNFIDGKKGNKAVHIGPLDSPVLKNEIYDTLKECKNAGFSGLDILGWEWELSLNDLIIKEAKDDFDISLSLKTIPREVMDKRATDAGDIQFYELAYLKASLENNKSGTKIKLDEFVIPNVDELPKEVRAKVKHWSDYIDYWAVDWDFTETFHNEWQTYRTKQDKNLELETPVHTYDKKGKHRIMIKVIDIFGNDTSTIREILT